MYAITNLSSDIGEVHEWSTQVCTCVCTRLYLHTDFTLRLSHQNTFGVIICASSCVVLADRAPVTSSPLVVQITQILQSSGAGCCEGRTGGEQTESVRKMQKMCKSTHAYHTSVKFIARVNYCIHGDMRHKQLLLSMRSVQ